MLMNTITLLFLKRNVWLCLYWFQGIQNEFFWHYWCYLDAFSCLIGIAGGWERWISGSELIVHHLKNIRQTQNQIIKIQYFSILPDVQHVAEQSGNPVSSGARHGRELTSAGWKFSKCSRNGVMKIIKGHRIASL